MRIFKGLLSFLLAFFMTVASALAMENMEPVQIGDLEIYPIRDADTTMEANLLPDLAKFPEFKGVFANGPAPAVMQTYFLRSGDNRILIDAGWGQEAKIKGHTREGLKALNIQPEDITDILLTHLDTDHIGGLVENSKAVYPNATIWIAEPEAAAWQEGKVGKRSPESIARASDLLKIYGDHIKLFNYGTELLPGIKPIAAPGHTPGHTAYEIASKDQKLTVAGDLMHIHEVQLARPELSTVYDMDMEQAAKTRKSILQKSADEKTILAGMHFPMISPVLAREDGGYMMRTPR